MFALLQNGCKINKILWHGSFADWLPRGARVSAPAATPDSGGKWWKKKKDGRKQREKKNGRKQRENIKKTGENNAIRKKKGERKQRGKKEWWEKTTQKKKERYKKTKENGRVGRRKLPRWRWALCVEEGKVQMKKEWWLVQMERWWWVNKWGDGKGVWEQKYERPSLRGEERHYGWVRRERNFIPTKKKKTGGNWYKQEKWVSIGSDKCAVAYNFFLHSLQFVFQCPVRPYVLPFLQSSVPLIVGQIQM